MATKEEAEQNIIDLQAGHTGINQLVEGDDSARWAGPKELAEARLANAKADLIAQQVVSGAPVDGVEFHC